MIAHFKEYHGNHKNFKGSYDFGGCCLKIEDVCTDFQPYFKVHSLVSVIHTKSIILGQSEGPISTWSFMWWCHFVASNKYMLLATWEVCIGKNCDWGLENAAQGRRPITCLSFFPAVNWLTTGFLYTAYTLAICKPFAKNLTNEQARNSDARQRKIY